MVDLTQLSEEQNWGLEYAVQLQNENLPEEEQINVQDFINQVVRDIGDNHYRNLIQYKESLALQMFRSLSKPEQEALVAQFQIPDVIKKDKKDKK